MKKMHFVTSISLATLFLVLVGSELLASNTTQSAKPDTAQQEQGDKSPGMFSPEQQTKRFARTESLSVSLKKVTRCPECAGERAFTFDIEDKRTGATKRFTIQNETAQVDNIVIANPSRAVVFGSVTGTLQCANIVDLETGAIVDYFRCLFPSISRDGRFIAYVKGFPKFSPASEWSYVYLVYDLASSPAENRMSDSASVGEDPFKVGYPIYPPGNFKRKVYLTTDTRDESDTHTMASEQFFWLQDHVLAFVDRWNHTNRLVIADLNLGISQAQVTVKQLDTSEIVNIKSCGESKEATENLVIVTGISALPGDQHTVLLTFEPSGKCLKRSTLPVVIN